MKRLITFVCLIVIIYLGWTMITKGFDNSLLNIASYEVIEEKSEALTKKLASYDSKNQDEYETAVSNLNSSIRSYKDSKAKYEAILEELSDVLNKGSEEEISEVIEEVIYSDQEKYKVDFLLVTLGDYGAKEGVDVVYQLTTSSTTDPNSSSLNYFLADLKFTVTGPYMNVTNFIADLENDDKLSWEINEFAMGSGGSGVSATWTVKGVPIDSESYLESSTNTDGAGENGEELETVDGENNVTSPTTSDTTTVTNTTATTDNNSASNVSTGNVTNDTIQ